jgi:hypothetical protein
LAGEEEGLDLVHGVAHEGGTRRDVGHSELSDGPCAGGALRVLMEEALHLRGED